MPTGVAVPAASSGFDEAVVGQSGRCTRASNGQVCCHTLDSSLCTRGGGGGSPKDHELICTEGVGEGGDSIGGKQKGSGIPGTKKQLKLTRARAEWEARVLWVTADLEFDFVQHQFT